MHVVGIVDVYCVVVWGIPYLACFSENAWVKLTATLYIFNRLHSCCYKRCQSVYQRGLELVLVKRLIQLRLHIVCVPLFGNTMRKTWLMWMVS